MTFPVSGVEVPIWVPPVVACVISFFTSMGGVSGAFLLLPFQVSVLGFVSPAVTPTNLIFNVIGIPGGVYRYFREGRMAWPLAWNIIFGTLPGLFLGGLIRIKYLPDPKAFKLFVGCVLLYIGARMLVGQGRRKGPEHQRVSNAEERMRQACQVDVKSQNSGEYTPAVRTLHWSLSKTEYEFYGECFSFNTTALFVLALIVGVVGGVYGIGGGAIMAPFIVTFFGLPIHTIAGATLMGTCVTSVGGVIFYALIDLYMPSHSISVGPDWALGALFGVGGIVGMYLGAAAQRYVPSLIIKFALGLIITGLALKYVVGYYV